MENFLKIKKMLPDLMSADLELLIRECAYWIRKNSIQEALNTIRTAKKLTPEQIEKLKK